jgi:hypothetical protein
VTSQESATARAFQWSADARVGSLLVGEEATSAGKRRNAGREAVEGWVVNDMKVTGVSNDAVYELVSSVAAGSDAVEDIAGRLKATVHRRRS